MRWLYRRYLTCVNTLPYLIKQNIKDTQESLMGKKIAPKQGTKEGEGVGVFSRPAFFCASNCTHLTGQVYKHS